MADRIRRCKDRQEMERVVDDYVTLGYKIVSRGGDSVALRQIKPHDKHMFVFLVFGWWTFGLANLIYAAIPCYGEKVLVKTDTADSNGNAKISV